MNRIVDYDPFYHRAHLCYICSNVAVTPRQCFNKSSQGSQCKAFFCKECLLLYLDKKPFCPKCRTPIVSEKNFFMKPDKEFYKEHQEDIQIWCQYEGCRVKLSLEDIFAHQEECPNKTFRCKICCTSIQSVGMTQQDHQETQCLYRYRNLNRHEMCPGCKQDVRISQHVGLGPITDFNINQQEVNQLTEKHDCKKLEENRLLDLEKQLRD